MKPTIIALALLLALLLALAGLGAVIAGCGGGGDSKAKPGASAEKVLYHCPMHPTYTSDKPGDCPICGMRLVKIEPEQHEQAVEGSEPGAAGGHPTPGYVPVTISPEQQQLIGVRLARAGRGPGVKAIRTVGRVDYDETRLHHVHTKVEGWIGRLYVNYTGKTVQRGEPLFNLYSPELVSTQEEYLLARRAEGEAGSALVESVRHRLELWDIPASEIKELESTGKPKTYVDISSHVAGIVVEKKALDGMRAMPGEDLYLIADLTQVWVTASIYEYELPLVRVGQPAVVTLSYFPGETFHGRIAYIYPYLDERTRTAQVRLEFENPGLKLKPGMYANVGLEVPIGEVVTVPRNAVLDSGDRQIVLVATGGGRFEPRQVTLGQELEDAVVVLEGVREGEEVVVGAHFLIDSESQLKAALAAMGAAGAHQHGGQ